MRDFRVGDKVIFELGPFNTPRWNIDADAGSTSKWAVGLVDKANEQVFEVFSSDNFHVWLWPQPSQRSELFDMPGYIRSIEDIAEPKQQCTCPIINVWNGYGHDSNCPER